jgi:ParB family chromosome partitioning protein
MPVMQEQKPKVRSRLGRGLSSLISVSELDESSGMTEPPLDKASAAQDQAAGRPSSGFAELPLELIDANPHQPRRSFDEPSLADLAASMRSTGLIQPIVVRPVGERYQLIAGERRWRAAQLAELATLPAIVRDTDEITQAQMALVENIQRQDLNPIDRAQAYSTLMKQLGVTQGELAGRLGEDRTRIAHYVRLLELTPPVQELVQTGKLSWGHGKTLAGVEDPTEQERLANLAVEQGLSVRNLERLLNEANPNPTPPPATAAPKERASAAHLQQLEKSLSRQMGLRVQLKAAAKKGRGRMVIHYSSLDQFDELIHRLGISAELD